MKLTKAEKLERKALKARMLENGGFIFNDGRSTVAWVPRFKGADTGSFGTAVCNPSDTFRRKYGEYLALKYADQDYSIMERSMADALRSAYIWD